MKALLAFPVIIVTVLVDVITKAVAVAVLPPSGVPQPVLGPWFRFALVYNPGAAFGLYLGQYSRWIFMALTVAALSVLYQLYKHTAFDDWRRTLAIALVASGAIGNVIDRIRSDLGVVDFLDVGIGTHRWPTFNVADMAVSGGAFLLAWVLWHEDKREAAAAMSAAASGSSETAQESE